MKRVYFLGYKSDEFEIIKEEIKTGLNRYEIIEYLGHNIDIKEFVRIKLKALEAAPDYFLLDVRALESTDYTSILSFKSNIMDKYPDLKGFLVIAQQSDGLSIEEYNDIIRNSVNGKNYTLFCDSDSEKTAKEIVSYICAMDRRKKKGEERLKNDGMNKSFDEMEIIEENIDLGKEGIENTYEQTEENDVGKTEENQEGRIEKKKAGQTDEREFLVHHEGRRLKKISDNESFRSMKRRFCVEDLWKKEEDKDFVSDAKRVYEIRRGNPKRNWDCKDEIVAFFGSKKGIGTSFIAMNLALTLSSSGSKTDYVQLAKLPNMDEMARDYGMKKIEGYYRYNGTAFMINEFLDDMNCHVLDLGVDPHLLKRAIELEWLKKNRLFIVSNGSNEGLKNLDECLFHLRDEIGCLNVIIVNPILNKDRYETYEEEARVYYFEYVKTLSDDKNDYNLGLMTDAFYRDIHQKQ